VFARGGGYKKVHYVFADDIFTKGCVCKTNCTGLLTGGGGGSCDGCNFSLT